MTRASTSSFKTPTSLMRPLNSRRTLVLVSDLTGVSFQIHQLLSENIARFRPRYRY